MKRRYMVAGNWKMNGGHAENRALMSRLAAQLAQATDIDVLVCPPAVYLDSVHAALAGSRILLGGQNLSEQPKPGAYTGESHGAMLRDCGASHVLVGHSERRALYGEADALVAHKFQTARELGLVPVLCLGETLAQREAGETEAVLSRQLGAVLEVCGVESFEESLIAYEPVWAIGTGKTATPAQAQDAHAFLRELLRTKSAKISGLSRILYGGSVKADNAQELFAGADVDGGLIGGASLKADEFVAICKAAQTHAGS